MQKKSVEIHQLSVVFQDHRKIVPALDQLNFNLHPGETLVLLGESGCGKSLTSLALMRLLPKSGVYGIDSQIRVDGQDILDLSEHMMRQLRGRKIAMIFQEPMTALNPVMTIGEQLAEVLLKYQSITSQELEKSLLSLLNEVEMPHPKVKIHQYPHQLSGGQKQRVVIAMALACRPDILIADEPTTALDVTVQAQILNLLKKVQNTRKMSMLLITHDLGVVKAMATHVGVMYAGQIVAQLSIEEFFSRQTQHPYVQQLLDSVPSFAKRQERLSVIYGCVPPLDEMPLGCRFHPRCIYAFSRCQQEEPQLQELNGQLVRCHLYPDMSELPPLEKNKVAWNRTHSETKSILRVTNLSIAFVQKKRIFSRHKTFLKAVDGLSFRLHQGKTLALVGESGCGKTTTSRALLRLLPIVGGEIHYKDQDVLTLRGRALRDYRKKVQIIFQDPYSSMNPRMTVGEILAEGMHAQGMTHSLISKRQKELLNHVNLPSTSLQRYPHQFSGGQRQRICIARALATEPEILICDEPTSALDVSVQAQILNLLKELQQETGISYLFITHNMGVVSYIADEVLVMKDGIGIEFGTCESILQHPKEAYTRQLLNAVLNVF
ncbi:ABC transporter ATP-binding protein [Legionella longbeachae]|uniref:ABC-type dipeptide transporter n=1 Tax=Legionella longbeachae serogroup 1 (strain NSW150) TaxID=661367 RepID=D3HQD8_LEGLN|nr:ABC transporter ATP-binding protein [Legionella longbeachae]VEE01624.1 peptide transport fused subunits of ABC superfamily: ATP-binding components [Legionella oakridgensis]HBD7396384.1 ABC transporter ATP-binding protein [Legionella pneumophila]ARB92035.1 ABC transporter ATP-binding protein [Legionella longbeachae]ARM35450.1 ABC transporter ATP-binding protein [Legionella longbeachae]EEZ95785.1 glutathione import ATP-binding protein GsiA [Legionella longbeachae D-4968]